MARSTKAVDVPANWQSLQHHPLSSLVEFGAGINMDALSAHMRENGYDEDEPIILYEGKILAGRHRHAAAIEAGVTPVFREFIGKDPRQLVVKDALRRHLSTSQRAMIAAVLVSHEPGKPKTKSGHKCTDSLTVSEGAKKLGVSEHSVKNASTVLAHGTPEQIAEVKSGQVTVTAAAEEIRKPVFCERCTRNGPSRDCPQCEALRASKPRKKGKAKPSKNGQEAFSLSAAKMHLGRVMAEADKLNRLAGCTAQREHSVRAAIQKLIDKIEDLFKTWANQPKTPKGAA